MMKDPYRSSRRVALQLRKWLCTGQLALEIPGQLSVEINTHNTMMDAGHNRFGRPLTGRAFLNGASRLRLAASTPDAGHVVPAASRQPLRGAHCATLTVRPGVGRSRRDKGQKWPSVGGILRSAGAEPSPRRWCRSGRGLEASQVSGGFRRGNLSGPGSARAKVVAIAELP